MKRKLKKVCEMSEYLTLIPLLREMCFPCYHSCLEKKKWQWIWETEISMFVFFFFSFFLSKWANVIWVPNMKPLILLSFFFNSIPHLSSWVYFLSYISPFLSLWHSVCPQTLWRKQPPSILHVFFFNLFCIYFCWNGWRQDGSRFVWQAPSVHPPVNFVWFLSFSIPSLLLLLLLLPVSSCSF